MPDQVQDYPGAPGPVHHCPTCGHLLTCKGCGLTEAAHDAAVEEKWVAPHDYKEYLNG